MHFLGYFYIPVLYLYLKLIEEHVKTRPILIFKFQYINLNFNFCILILISFLLKLNS